MGDVRVRGGGCQCGAVRFEVTGEPERVYCCHCLECRRQSSAAFGISVIHAPEALRLVRGSPALWSRETDSGAILLCRFCPECGTRVWHEGGGTISIKGGALDEPPEPHAHIWLSRKLPWVVVPDGIETWPEEPGTEA